ncbi:MAG: hypothetical protein J6L86_02785 [Alphaproteobacteria bacterium]|nr:hypothetical protein [Alphaproteobacteria bacterium]
MKTLQGAVILAAPYFIRSYFEKSEQQDRQQVKKEIRTDHKTAQTKETGNTKVLNKADWDFGTKTLSKISELVSEVKSEKKSGKQTMVFSRQKTTASQARLMDKIVAKIRTKPNKKADNRRYETQKISLSSTLNKYASKNGQRLCQIENKIVAMIALMENYEAYPYMSGGAATIGYGSCYKPNGMPVTMHDAPIDKTTARLYTQAHLRKDVFPAIEKYVHKDLDDGQLMAVSAFIYAVGSANFAGLGYDDHGRKRQPSEFLKAVNSGKSDFECARKLSGWKTAGGGILHEGLLKRRWLEMALYCHRLEPQELLDMTPGGHFNLAVRDLYKHGRADKDGYYTPMMDDATMRRVMQKCKTGRRRLKDIIDEKTLQNLKSEQVWALTDFAQRYAALRTAGA